MSRLTLEMIAAARRVFGDAPMPLTACLSLRDLAAASAKTANSLFPEDAGQLTKADDLDDGTLGDFLSGESLGGWALTATSLAILQRLILERQPKTVLEFGSGRSTVALAHFMKLLYPGACSTLVISVEQNESYLEGTQRLLARTRLDDVVRLVHAPIRRQVWGDCAGECYDLSDFELGRIASNGRPGLVLVDGPVGGFGVRFGTIPMVFDVLDEDAIVVMDDALRDSELAIARWWEQLGYTAGGGVLWNGKGTYLATKGHGPGNRGTSPRRPTPGQDLLSKIAVHHSRLTEVSTGYGLSLPFAWQTAVVAARPNHPDPKISIVIPTKDRPSYLRRALQSIAGQCYSNWEAIVVNDGGVPVREVVDDFADPQRLRYVDRDSSGGPSAARNAGLALATGEIVTYLDDDDRFLPNHLSTIADAFRDESVHVAYTEAEYVLERECDGIQVDVSRSLPYSGIEYSRRLLLVQNFIPQVVLAHKRECLDVVGRFDESFPALVDWEFFLRLSEHYAFLHVPQVTVEARTVVDGRTNVSRSRRARFPELFARVYIRHPDAGDLWVRQQREKMLQQLFSGDDLPTGVRSSGGMSTSEGQDAERYARWVERNTLSESSAQYMAERMMLEWRSQPLFHILILHERGEEEALADTLDSLGRQLYQGWGLSVISAATAPEGFDSVPNVEWVTVEGSRFDAANAVAWQSTADWILLLEPGSTVAPEALFSIADYLQTFPAWRLVYADEDRIALSGERHNPLFKPDFNLDLLRSTAYVGKYIAVRRELLVGIGGVRDHGEATAYDVVFRVLEAAGEGSIGHIAKVLFHRSDRFQRRYDPAAASEEGRRVVQAHLERVGVRATVSAGQLALTQAVDYAFDRAPKVSVIVPTRDQAALLQACVDSVLEITRYPDYEVLIVDNGSADAAALSYMVEVANRDVRVRVLRYEKPYSFSAINNFAAGHASGEILLLLNNDTQVLHDDWMTRMVGNVLRPEVGVVGARLVFPDGRIQHAGVVLGLMGTADHPGIGAPMEEPGYMGRLQVAQNYSAVTGACLMVRKAVYEQVGGLDERDFNVLFNDVDFCLKLVKAGYRNVWTPHATLVHHASVSIKANVDAAAVERALRERAALQERWSGWLAADPAFNRNLSLASQRVCVESEIAPAWDPIFRDRPRLMAFPLDAQGTGHYRVWGPLAALDRASLAQFSLLPAHGFQATQVRVPNLPELLRAAPDTLLVQHGYLDLFLEWIERYRRHSRTFLACGQDDNLLDVPDDNPLKKKLVDGLEGRMARAMGQCDRLIVTTQPLVEVYRRFIDDIRVVPNQLDGSRWLGLASERRAGRKPRVGWAGALQHLGDLKWLEPVVRALHREVEWVFMGMCPDNLRPYVAEFHAPVPLPKYPAALAKLNLDLAIAPLEMHRFNEAKSDLRILEYGALGWPVIATDIYPYQGKPVTVLGNQPDRWTAAIRERVNDLDALALEGDRLREWVLSNRLLENNLDAWVRALFSDEVLREYGVLRALAA